MSKILQKTFFALGTVNSIYAPQLVDQKCLQNAIKRVMELDDRLSVFKQNSDISQINIAAGKNYVKVHPDTWEMIKTAVHFSEISAGTFDITIRPLVELWGIGKKEKYIPMPKLITKTLCLVNYQDILFDEQEKRIMLRRSGQAIDLGAIAKGYAADEVRRILGENGITNALINLGGTVISLGTPHAIGIQNPLKPTGMSMGRLEIKDLAVVTSGSYEKFFVQDEKIYHHILDPRTGNPANSGLQSITLIGKSAMELDALSTAIFILGIEKGRFLAERYRAEAIFVTQAQDVLTTPGLKNSFSLV